MIAWKFEESAILICGKGVKVKATLIKRDYETGIEIAKEDVASLNVRRHDTLPAWNYTITPRRSRSAKM